MIGSVLGHGFGDVGDLPVSLGVLLAASGGAVLLTAARVGGRRAPASQARPGAAVPTPLTDTAGPAARVTARAVAGLVFAFMVVVAAVGDPSPMGNPAGPLFHTVLWTVLLVGSAVLGGIWTVANPLRVAAAGMAWGVDDPDEAGLRTVPESVGLWPAAVVLLIFWWVQQVVAPYPAVVGVFVLVYALAQLGGVAVYGREWLTHGDGFEAASRVIGGLTPLGRDPEGRVRIRSPRAGLGALPVVPGLLAVVAALVGADLFDAVSDSAWWRDVLYGLPGPAVLAAHAAGLLACAGAVYGVGRAVTRGGYLVPALVPLVVSYGVAHYFGPFLVDAQLLVATLSDPFARGWDLFGTAAWAVRYQVVSPTVAAVVQLVVFVAGHVLAVAVAHDLARARHGPRAARADQFLIRVVVVVSAVGGVALRFAA